MPSPEIARKTLAYIAARTNRAKPKPTQTPEQVKRRQQSLAADMALVMNNPPPAAPEPPPAADDEAPVNPPRQPRLPML